MTDEQIIRAVAERVMGWKECLHGIRPCWCYPGDYDMVMKQDTWNPLTDANHMMLVVEKMREKGWYCKIVYYKNIIEVEFWKSKGESFVASHDEIGHATCLAALQAERGI